MDYNKKILLNYLLRNYSQSFLNQFYLSYSNIPIVCEKVFKRTYKRPYDGRPFIHVRKETYEWDLLHHNYSNYGKYNGPMLVHPSSILIDCIDQDYLHLPFQNRIFVPWFAISIASRNISLDILNKPVKYFIKEEKNEFCSFIYSNVGGNSNIKRESIFSLRAFPRRVKNYLSGTYDKTRYFKNNYEEYVSLRYNFFSQLNTFKKVDRPFDDSRFSDQIFNNATKLMYPYKFNIAFENSLKSGWVTEKILNSFLAGCIPVYLGDESVFNFFNPKAFIFYNNFNTHEDLIDYLLEVDRNKNLYEEYINQPICTENGLQLIRSFFNEQF